MPPLLPLLRAVPLVAAAWWRLSRLDRELPLDVAVAQLRARGGDDGASAGAADADTARAAAALVEAFLPVAPAVHLGPCLRRSLLLVDVLSRCGFAPRLRLGVRRRDGWHGHAWVEVPGLVSTGDRGYTAAFEL